MNTSKKERVKNIVIVLLVMAIVSFGYFVFIQHKIRIDKAEKAGKLLIEYRDAKSQSEKDEIIRRLYRVIYPKTISINQGEAYFDIGVICRLLALAWTKQMIVLQSGDGDESSIDAAEAAMKAFLDLGCTRFGPIL